MLYNLNNLKELNWLEIWLDLSFFFFLDKTVQADVARKKSNILKTVSVNVCLGLSNTRFIIFGKTFYQRGFCWIYINPYKISIRVLADKMLLVAIWKSVVFSLVLCILCCWKMISVTKFCLAPSFLSTVAAWESTFSFYAPLNLKKPQDHSKAAETLSSFKAKIKYLFIAAFQKVINISWTVVFFIFNIFKISNVVFYASIVSLLLLLFYLLINLNYLVVESMLYKYICFFWPCLNLSKKRGWWWLTVLSVFFCFFLLSFKKSCAMENFTVL